MSNKVKAPDFTVLDKDGYVVTAAQGAIDEATLRYGVSLIYAGGENSENRQNSN